MSTPRHLQLDCCRYVLMPIISCAILALYGNQLFPAVHYWIWVLAAIAIATALNLRGVNWLARVLSVLVYALLLVIVYIGALIILWLWLNLPAASKTAGTIWLAIGIAYTAFTTGFFRQLWDGWGDAG